MASEKPKKNNWKFFSLFLMDQEESKEFTGLIFGEKESVCPKTLKVLVVVQAKRVFRLLKGS